MHEEYNCNRNSTHIVNATHIPTRYLEDYLRVISARDCLLLFRTYSQLWELF